MRVLSTLLGLLLASFSALAASQGDESGRESLEPAKQQSATKPKTYYSDRERGWFWYEDPVEVEKEEQKKPDPVAGATALHKYNSKHRTLLLALSKRFG